MSFRVPVGYFFFRDMFIYLFLHIFLLGLGFFFFFSSIELCELFYILEIKPWSVTNIFSHFVGCLFISFMISLAV